MKKVKLFLVSCITMIIILLQANSFKTYAMYANSMFVVWSEEDCEGAMIVAADHFGLAEQLACCYGGFSIEDVDACKCTNLMD